MEATAIDALGYDVVVVGGGAAGLTAAMVLARSHDDPSRGGRGLVRREHPGEDEKDARRLAEQIAGAVTAYACGDALGLPWEGLPPAGASAAEIEALPGREGWDRGATSDDTALTLLVARHLAGRGGAGDARVFLQTLAAAAEAIKGLGPSTRGAIEHFQATGEPPTSGGTTNGAPMRALPVGPDMSYFSPLGRS